MKRRSRRSRRAFCAILGRARSQIRVVRRTKWVFVTWCRNILVDVRSPRPFDVQQFQRPQLLQMQTVQESHSISQESPHQNNTEPANENSADASPVATPLSEESSRHNSLQEAYIDQDALDRLLQDDRTGTMHSAASSEPDYASTVSSNHEPRRPVDRPRAGRLKTVGNPDLAPHDPKVGRLDTWQQEVAAQTSEVPNINFGPTYAYKPTGRPGSSGTIMAGALEGENRSKSRDRLRSSNTPGGLSPSENYRNSYFGGAPEGDNSRDQSRRQSVAWTPSGGSPSHQQRFSLTPEQWVAHRAAMAAQPQYPPQGAHPGISHQRTGSSGSFNAQQFRKASSKTPPPFGRTNSGDWTQQVQDQRTPPSRPHSRAASMYLNQMGNYPQQVQSAPASRPHSRGASMYLNQASGMPQQERPAPPSRPRSRGAGAYLNQIPPPRPHSRGAGMYLNPPSGLVQGSHPTNLSAREQMHVARATGTPLLDTSANARKKQQIDEKANAGLVGAIGTREREKAAMKSSHRSSMVVEHAIRARQEQQAEAQMQAYQQQMQEMQQQQQSMYYGQQQQGLAGPGTPGAQYGYAGGYMTPQQQQQYQQQQMWQQQQQQQGAQTPGNRQSWFGGSYFGQQGGQ